MRNGSRLGLVALAMASVVAVAATASEVAAAPWHAGLDVRIDQGAHPLRVGGGVELGNFDTLLVLDPMVVTDGQHDLDLLVSWCPCDHRGFAVMGGVRSTAIGIEDGHQLQEKLVVGITAPLPALGTLPLRARWSFELATVVVKHGAGLPTDWIGFAQGRDFIDLVNFGMFVTFEYAQP